MKILAYIIFLIIVFPIFSHAEGSDYVTYAHNITGKVSKKLEKKHKMSLFGTGGGMMHCVEMMSMSFEIYRSLNLDEARRLIIDCVKEYAQAINNDEKIRPYLKTYPFKNVHIVVYIENSDGSNIYHPDICIVSYENKKVVYRTKDKNKKYGYKSEWSETFEEALQIIQQQESQKTD